MGDSKVAPWVKCRSCGGMLVVGPAELEAYVMSREPNSTCPSCSSVVDWWVTIAATVEENFFFVHALELTGARTSVFTRNLRRDETLEINLTSEGIPDDAYIVSVNITPQGPGPFPAEIRQHYFAHERIGHSLRLHAVAPAGSRSADSCRIAFMVTWWNPSQDVGQECLFDALHAYSVETLAERDRVNPRWNRIVVPASQAMELIIGRAVSDASRSLSVHTKGLNFSTELNVMLPLLTRLLSVPPMPVKVVRAVDELRVLRNEIIHEGVTKQPITRQRAAQLLTGALLAWCYVAAIRDQLRSKRQDSPPPS